MPSTSLRSGGFRLFQLAGVNVYLHWSWLLVAVYEINAMQRERVYSSVAWNIAEYLALFLIVLTHEFGHALACRSVGGVAERIILWPLGGVAFVRPPQRPGAMLWSIVAGPLVNVALVPVTFGAYYFAPRAGLSPDVNHFLLRLTMLNVILLIFNLLPIYPLDGGKILQSLLWFIVGQARSLMIASVLGMISAAAIVLLLLVRGGSGNTWLIIMGVFAIMQSWSGLKSARMLSTILALPRHENFHCPACRQSPPVAPMWRCRCENMLDIFASNGVCPNCGTHFAQVPCPLCGLLRPWTDWLGPRHSTPLAPPPIPLNAPTAFAVDNPRV